MRKLIATALPVVLLILVGCDALDEPEPERPIVSISGGSPDRGETAIRKYGCYTCHTIPGIKGADALVGPSLENMGLRTYIAGHLPNTPENMISWIQDPKSHRDPTAMPDMDVTDQDARDIAAYLYTLR